jgi:hypothetical protein
MLQLVLFRRVGYSSDVFSSIFSQVGLSKFDLSIFSAHSAWRSPGSWEGSWGKALVYLHWSNEASLAKLDAAARHSP